MVVAVVGGGGRGVETKQLTHNQTGRTHARTHTHAHVHACMRCTHGTLKAANRSWLASPPPSSPSSRAPHARDSSSDLRGMCEGDVWGEV